MPVGRTVPVDAASFRTGLCLSASNLHLTYDYPLGVPDSSENLQSGRGLKWKEMQREND